MANKKDFPSIFEFGGKGFTVKHYSHSVPIMYVIIFYVITLIVLVALAFVSVLFQVFLIIFILLTGGFIAYRFVTHKEDFVSEKIGLEYVKLSLGAKGMENITEGEIIEGVQPVFEEKKALQKPIKQAIEKKGVAVVAGKK